MAHPCQPLAIPTQVIHDRQGQEVYRHADLVDQETLRGQLDHTLGAK